MHTGWIKTRLRGERASWCSAGAGSPPEVKPCGSTLYTYWAMLLRLTGSQGREGAGGVSH